MVVGAMGAYVTSAFGMSAIATDSGSLDVVGALFATALGSLDVAGALFATALGSLDVAGALFAAALGAAGVCAALEARSSAQTRCGAYRSGSRLARPLVWLLRGLEI